MTTQTVKRVLTGVLCLIALKRCVLTKGFGGRSLKPRESKPKLGEGGAQSARRRAWR